ncbi:hypothetical protein [Anaerotignum propionicum]|uniref:hypothetical protein n=1 Tax=Anaerotignum propionicum TaxID=28446 RepID=UPI002897B53B|nr:hypothetical protein [Anaerotignum propionicum]
MRKLRIFALILLLVIFWGHQSVLTSDSPIESSVQAVQVPAEEDETGLSDRYIRMLGLYIQSR